MIDDKHSEPAHGAAATPHADSQNGPSLTPERWEQAKNLFEAAQKLDPGERDSFLNRACPDDPALRHEVESLLSGERRAGDFLDKPILADAGKTDSGVIPIGTLSVGQVLAGRFRVIRFLGQGGMGEVYEAKDLDLGERVALKTILPKIASEPRAMARFKQEIQLARRVTHPNVCRMFDLERHRPPPETESSASVVTFLTMELLEGETLAARLRRVGRITTAEALPLVQQMAEALAAAHDVGVVHRDFKPGNVMLVPAKSGDEKERAVVTDFGLAKALAAADQAAGEGPASSVTASGHMVGTLAYIAPEQLQGREATAASDIYALGLVMYEMVAGKRPFPDDALFGGAYQRITQPPASPCVHVPDLDPRWEEAILRCLKTDQAARFPDARQVASALQPRVLVLGNSGRRYEGDHTKVRYQESGPLSWLFGDKGIPRSIPWKLTGGLVLVALSFWLLWRLLQPPPGPQNTDLIQLTTDNGLTWEPTLSDDGKLLAYSSDRGGSGNLEIWSQFASSGPAIQVTHSAADNTDPALSPDGSRIVYRSEREGGGVYMDSTYGGDERLVAKYGRNPRFSPDGTLIVYWIGDEANASLGTGKLYVISAQGGAATQIQAKFADARYPTWGPDNRHILFLGTRSNKSPLPATWDWWVASLDDGKFFETHALDILRRQQMVLHGSPAYWFRDRILFAARLASSVNLWQIPVSPDDWKVSGPLRRVTFGSAEDTSPWLSSNGRLVFSSRRSTSSVWEISASGDSRNSAPSERQLTFASAFDLRPSISADGEHLVFARRSGSGRDVWLKDLETGHETALTLSAEAYAVINRDGDRIAYSFEERDRHPISVISIGNGLTERVCYDCGEVLDWWPDGKRLLYAFGSPTSIGSLEVASGQSSTLLRASKVPLDQAQISPDGHWVAFVSRIDGDHSTIFVAPLRGELAATESDWIPLTDGRSWDDKPRWSEDGTSIFLMSKRDGFRCIWWIRLDSKTHRAVGEPTAVKHFHSARRSLMFLDEPAINLSVAGRQLVFNLVEMSGNVWMISFNPYQ
ncbi:MAG: protein kinase domain-containing protein [Terriglobia bacterium]